jgi:hypothetical protein
LEQSAATLNTIGVRLLANPGTINKGYSRGLY